MSINNESIHSSSEGGGAEEKLHKFNPLPHAPEPPKTTEVKVYQTEENIYSKETILNSHPEEEEKKLPSTILGATFMLTNICLGTTIFTFAVKAKSFGLVWLLVCCTIVAIVNYWTITRGVLASSKCDKFDDFSEIVEYHLGKKWRLILNFFLILYSYACVMCFLFGYYLLLYLVLFFQMFLLLKVNLLLYIFFQIYSY